MKQLLGLIALGVAALGIETKASEATEKFGSKCALKNGQEDNYEDRCVQAVFKNLSSSRFQRSHPDLTHHAFDKN